MKFIDMFCGMGTVRTGFERAGHTCVYSIEWDKFKRKIYEVIFGGEPEGRDITAVRGSDLPFSDCWTFGAPCQDFSIAGARSGMAGERSSLVREVFRLVREVEEERRPEWLLYENVKGMLSSNKGLDYLEILIEMESLGYDIEWQLLNSKNFGVPQNRERVYTLGHSRRYGPRKIFPLTKNGGLLTEHIETNEGQSQAKYSSTLTAKSHTRADGTYINEIRQIGNFYARPSRQNPQAGRVYDANGISPCLDSARGGNRQPFIVTVEACLTPSRAEKRQNGRRFKTPGEPMFTLTAQDIHGVKNNRSNKKRVHDCAERR